MTKEAYFEMCEALNADPVEKDIPLEQADLLPDVLLAYNIYSLLAPKFDSFAGVYHGKDYSNLSLLFNMYEVTPEYQREYFKIILTIDGIDSEQINAKLQQKASKIPAQEKKEPDGY